jgi:hypothetical protein
MAEHVNNSNAWIASGGHVWLWDKRDLVDKRITVPGLTGAGRMVLVAGSRRGRISGREGAPGALLKGANGATISGYETTIENLIAAGTAVSWEDDMGRSGTALVLLGYRRVGYRFGDGNQVWQFYELDVEELGGAI